MIHPGVLAVFFIGSVLTGLFISPLAQLAWLVAGSLLYVNLQKHVSAGLRKLRIHMPHGGKLRL